MRRLYPCPGQTYFRSPTATAYFLLVCITRTNKYNQQTQIWKSQNYIPEGRRELKSALINDKLYFFGVAAQTTNCSNEIFYIDLSSTFDISTLPFKQVSIGMPVAVYKFDPINLQWTIPITSGFNNSFINRNEINAVIDSKGKSYIFSGTDYNEGYSAVDGKIFYEMSLFDTTSMTWSTLTLPTKILPRIDYTATLLPIDCSGATIQPRAGHSAVLKHDYFGGANGAIQVYPDLAVLNTNTWIWSVPNNPRELLFPPWYFAISTMVTQDFLFLELK
ncbi:galactose oxidase [Gigaspora margarita]|uniref:Galactose oxidase n=1 Tax=Gigaspora margarita TaxID=4874 RepID=A0A8H4ATG3_GIGMA|nr:galactose oxidase [Gigaspora margarita]